METRRLDDLLAEWQERVDRGEAPAPEELCRGRPDLLAEFCRRVAVLRQFQRAAAGGQDTLVPPGPSDDTTLPPADHLGSPTLTRPPGGPATAPPPALEPGDVPPGYAVERELGRGGMGVVYLARHLALNRPVALKMVLSGAHASPQELVRFLQEAEAVAQLRHPNVVQVYEVGSHQGRPYMALEFCDGGALDKKLAGSPVKAGEAADLVRAVARGVEAAHAQGIIHRDLKPQNVLLVADGTPKVTDFGLAKRAGSGSDLTATGAILGTPSYMAPEQAEGKGKGVGPAADVYALGAILYEALTGRPPFRAATPLDTVLQVVSDEPVPPRQLNPQVPRDLETIALKCLQKDPKKRYASAEALGADLGRWADGEPIAARPVGWLERAWKWTRRNKAVAGGAAGVAAALLLGTLAATWQAVRASAEADRADHQAAEAGRETLRAEANAAEARKQEGLARAQEEAARQEEQRAVQSLADLKAEKERSAYTQYANGINRAHTNWHALNTTQARAALADTPAHLRGWEWAFLDRHFEYTSLPLRGHGSFVLSSALSPDGAKAYTVGMDRTVRFWDARSGAELRTVPVAGHRLALSPDGRRLVVATGQMIRLYDPDNARELTTTGLTGFPCGLAFVRGGRELAVLTVDGVVTFRDPASLAERRRAPKRLALDPGSTDLLNLGVGAVFSPDGRLVAQGGVDCKVRVWDAATGERLMEGEGHLKMVGEVAFSPDGKFLASPGGEGQIRVWDLNTKQTVRTLRGHRSWAWAVAYSPDGTRLASAAKDLTARVWDPATGEALLTLTGHGGEVRTVGFSGDGSRLVTGSPDGTALVWDPADRVVMAPHVRDFFAKRTSSDYGRTGSAEHLTFYSHVAPALTVACSPDGRLVASSAGGDEHADHQVTVWDVDARREVARFRGPKVRGHPLAFTPDGKRLVVSSAAGADRPVRVTAFEIPGGESAWTWDSPLATVAHPAVSADGRRVAVLTQAPSGGWLAVLDAATGREVFRKELKAMHVGPAFAGDDRWLVVADAAAGKVRVLDAGTGDPVREWSASNSGLTTVAAGPGGKVATADGKAVIKVWDGDSGRDPVALEGHAGFVLQMAFGPDGRLVSVGNDFTARVWDVGTGHELLTFRDHADIPMGVAWSRDGSRLATACQDGAVRVWQGPPPDTASVADAWPVRFADRFDRADPGDRWRPVQGSWEVQDGALRGVLKPNTIGATKFHIAQTALTTMGLPNRADVRFRFRPSRPMVLTVPLADRTGYRLIYQPLLAGACHLPGSPTAFVMQITLPTGKVADMKVANLGRGARFDMAGGRWYAVRVLREPERLRVWVDGVLIVSERIPDVDLPALNLQGSWAEAGDTIEFDDVEVRAPDDAVRELAVRTRTLELFATVLVRAEVRRQLAADSTVTPADLAVIDRALAGLAEDPQKLESKSWEVVRRPGADAEAYRLALARAEAAVRLDPQDPEALGTLGLAQVRAGQPKAAADTLTKAVGRAREEYGAAWPTYHAGLALAHHALGERAAARAEAGRLQSLMRADRWAADGVAKMFVGEVEEALGADSQADRTADAIVRWVLDRERAGWIKKDLAAYLALHAPDVVVRTGRGPEPDQYDVTLDRKQLEAARRVQFRGPAHPGVTNSVEDATVTVDGDTAELRWRWTVHAGANYETYGGHYRLVRSAGEWRVKELRSWEIARRKAGEREGSTPEEWAARDKAADALASSPDAAARVAALKKAGRPAEALRVATRATDAGKGDAALWAERGDLAFTLGDVPAALAAFGKAEGLDPDVRLPWYMTRARVAFLKHRPKGASSAAFVPGGSQVVTAGGDGHLRFWESTTGAETGNLRAGEELAGLVVSRDGHLVATSGVNVHVFERASGRRRATGKGHTGLVFRLDFHPGGRRMVSASADGTARIWDAETGRELRKFDGHGKPVLGAAFSPDGRHVVSCGNDDLARLWDAETGVEVLQFKGHTKGVNRAVFSPDGTRLATASRDQTVKVWEVATGKLVRTLTGHEQVVDVAAFSADGKSLATGDWAGVIRVWDPATGAKKVTLRDHPGPVFGLAFASDGKSLVASGNSHPVVYDLGPTAAVP